MLEYILNPDAYQMLGADLMRLRNEANLTQGNLAKKASLTQSQISRIEKGDDVSKQDFDCIIDALVALGVNKAEKYREFLRCEWKHIKPPSFWNPQRASLETAEKTLEQIESFLEDDDRPWPLRRQFEQQQRLIHRASSFLNCLKHNIAFIGNIGVGKSTAISFIFDLLGPTSAKSTLKDRPVLETGGGRTTICEVRIKSGPEFGIILEPMPDTELKQLVSDFCATKWFQHSGEQNKTGETIGVSREIERAIRNMSGLTTKRETIDKKIITHDPITELVQTSNNEDAFRIQILERMKLDQRTQRELWYDIANLKDHPLEWIKKTFKAVNNGRLENVPLPKSINILIPNFGQTFNELELTVIDTKGVEEVTVREDLDLRLKDPHTAVVFCSHFNDAPGTTAHNLLQHMQQTFSERLDTGKVAILALPRSEEALAVKDDAGEEAQTDAEGYDIKREQVVADLAADGLSDIPMIFFNVAVDEADAIRSELFDQLDHMRKTEATALFDLCDSAHDIIKDHENVALNEAIKEVAKRLKNFLEGNRALGAREQRAHEEALKMIKGLRYASILWASARRDGNYEGLNIHYLIGVGAANDASLRSESWFDGLTTFLNALEADEGLKLANRSIKQISITAEMVRQEFLNAAQLEGNEIYYKPLSQAPVWRECVGEWGQGSGFKSRVADHLEEWFKDQNGLKDQLEQRLNDRWEEKVIAPLLKFAEESEPDT